MCGFCIELKKGKDSCVIGQDIFQKRPYPAGEIDGTLVLDARREYGTYYLKANASVFRSTLKEYHTAQAGVRMEICYCPFCGQRL